MGFPSFGPARDGSVQGRYQSAFCVPMAGDNCNCLSKLDCNEGLRFGATNARLLSYRNLPIGGTAMRKLCYLLVLVALSVVFASSASANPIDPKVGLGGGGSCASFNQAAIELTITVPTGCIVDFTNMVPGLTMTNLIVTINTAFSGLLSCAIDLTQPGNGGVSPFSVAQQTAPNACTFSGPPAFPDAVLPGGFYGIQFGYPGLVFQTCDTQGNCTPLSSLSVSLTTVPEPASIALIGTGLVAMAVGRKKLKGNR